MAARKKRQTKKKTTARLSSPVRRRLRLSRITDQNPDIYYHLSECIEDWARDYAHVPNWALVEILRQEVKATQNWRGR